METIVGGLIKVHIASMHPQITTTRYMSLFFTNLIIYAIMHVNIFSKIVI